MGELRKVPQPWPSDEHREAFSAALAGVTDVIVAVRESGDGERADRLTAAYLDLVRAWGRGE